MSLLPPLPQGEGWGRGENSCNAPPHPVLLPEGEGTPSMLRCALFTVLLSNWRLTQTNTRIPTRHPILWPPPPLRCLQRCNSQRPMRIRPENARHDKPPSLASFRAGLLPLKTEETGGFRLSGFHHAGKAPRRLRRG